MFNDRFEPHRIRIVVAAAVLVVVVGGAPVGTTASAEVAAFGVDTLASVVTVAVSPTTGRVIVGIGGGGSGEWLSWSDDHGAHWQLARGLEKNVGVTALAFSRSQPNIVYAGVYTTHSAFLVSSDGGTSWRAASWKQRVTISKTTLPAPIQGLVVDPSRPDTVYADTHGMLRRTLDGGMTWTTLPRRGLPPIVGGGRPGEVYGLGKLDQQLVSDAAGTLYYSTGLARGPRQIYRSTSGGTSWQPAARGLAPGMNLLQLASDGTPAGTAYAAGNQGVYATGNAGRTWRRILRMRARGVKSGPAGVFVLAAPWSLMRRGSSGGWTRLNAPHIDAFALDPTNGSQLYAWSYEEEDSKDRYCATLFGTRNGGVTWESIGGALPLAQRNCRST
jgi:hypothetical protein